MWKTNSLANLLSIEVPIIQGPFGGGLSSVELTAAVSQAGGLGSFGAHHLPPEQIVATVKALRAKTSKPFALNLWVDGHDAAASQYTSAHFDRHMERLRPFFEALGLELPTRPARFGQVFDEQIEAVLQSPPPVLSFVFGVPSPEVIRACRARGIVTIGTATTPEEAVAVEAAGLDALVATGQEAGGHRAAFLKAPEEGLIGTFALVQLVRTRVRLPIIAAGAIADGRAVASMLVLGADGVQVGTAFLACEESGASETQRKAMFSKEVRETVLTRVFSGRLARSIRNHFTDTMAAHECDAAPYPIQGWMTGQLKAAAIAQDRADLMSLWAGQAVPLLRHRRATDLFADLVKETDQALLRYRQEV